LSNFPIDSLDRNDGEAPRWPSFGVTVLPNLPDGNDKVIPALAALRLLGPTHLLEDIITTALVGRDQTYLNTTMGERSRDPRRLDRRRVPRLRHHDDQVEALYANGLRSGPNGSLATWNWSAYLRRFR